MRHTFFSAILLIAIVSCNSSANEETSSNTSNEDETTEVDSLEADTTSEVSVDSSEINTLSINLENFKSKFRDELDLPLILDSTQLLKYRSESKDDSYNLKGEEVEFITQSFTSDQATSRSTYNTEVFVELDSIMQYGDYEKYQEELDIGMTRYSHANSIGYVQIEDDLRIYVWSLDYSSYEACPHSHGTFVYGSLFKNDQFQNTVLMGEESGGGDPPVWGKTRLSGELSSLGLVTNFLDMYGEYTDEGENEIQNKTEKHFEFEITPIGFQLVPDGI